MKLTKEQRKAVKKIINYIMEYEKGDKPMVINAAAGTGKSVVIKAVFRELNEFALASNLINPNRQIVHSDFYTTATINNVVIDLHNSLSMESAEWRKNHPDDPPPFKYNSIASHRSIYSILGYKVQTNLRTGKKELVRVYDPLENTDQNINARSPTRTGRLIAIDVMFIDEASLITKIIKKEIENYLEIPLIYVGDEFQMLSIDGDKLPSVFQKNRGNQITLNKLMRYDCKKYAKYINRLRYNVYTNRIDQIPDQMGEQLTSLPNMASFIKKVHKKFKKDPDNCCIISHTNKTANKYNKYIRTEVLEKTEEIVAGDLIYVDGELAYSYNVMQFAERLVKMKTVKERDHKLYKFLSHISAYYTMSLKVLSSTPVRRTNFPLGIIVYTQGVEGVMKDGVKDRVVLVTKISFEKDSKASQCPQLMKLVYKLNSFRFGYASTVHKMQGRTVDNVFVDLQSDKVMWKVSTINEIARFLYIALSRSRKNTFILGKVPEKVVRATFGWDGNNQ